MLSIIVARRPCGCVTAASVVSRGREYDQETYAWIGEMVVGHILYGDTITHEHEPVTFGGCCDKCRKEPSDV